VRTIPDVPITDERRAALIKWLNESLKPLQQHRDSRVKLIESEYEKTLDGVRPRIVDATMSNVSVPLSLWASDGIRHRVVAGVFGSKPVVVVDPVGGEQQVQRGITAKALARFLEQEILAPEALAGKDAGIKLIAETVRYGTSALKPIITADRATYQAGTTTVVPLYGRPRWEFISFKDLIYWDGYGTDTQAMPYVGHEFQRTWQEIMEWAALGHYDSDALDEIKAAHESHSRNTSMKVPRPIELEDHDIAELYVDWPLNDNNVPAPLLVDLHVRTGVALRVRWNMNYRGIRPIFVSQFDLPPVSTQLEGRGACDKLRGAQNEADEIHNIGIEAGKRAACFLTGIKAGTLVEEEFGGGKKVYPNDVYVTDNPSEDLVAVPLGDPKAAEIAIQLEQQTQFYVTEILGLSRKDMGDVTAGKRVPSSLGLPIMREGRVPTTAAFDSVTRVFTDALYLTITHYRVALPLDALIAAVGQEGADALRNTVFAAGSTSDPRREFLVSVTAQDAAAVQEQRKQEMLMVQQALLPLFDRMVQYAGMAIQMPPELKNIMTMILEKLQNGAKIMVTNIEAVQNPLDIIPDVAEALRGLDNLRQSLGGGGMGGTPQANADDNDPRGGGVV
jgi:hypothetical protein